DPTPAPSSRPCRAPGPAAAARSRLLQRGGGPLPPAGAVSVPDAAGLPRPLAQATGRPQRQLRLPDLEGERVVGPYPGRREEADGDGVDLREVPQLPGPVEAARSPGADLRLLGLSSGVAGLGVRDLSAAVRDRDELSADAPRTDPDHDAPAGGAVAVRGDR